MRIWAAVAAIIILVVVAGLVYDHLRPAATVNVARVRRDAIRESIDERGKTRLPRIHRITMPYHGRVESIELDVGAPVSEGQPVARIVREDLDLNVAAAQAAVDRLDAQIRENRDVSVEQTTKQQADEFADSMDKTVLAASERVKSSKASLDYSEKHLGRIQSLFETGNKTEDEYDQAIVEQIDSQVDYRQDVLTLAAVEAMRSASALMPTSVQQFIERKDLTVAVLEAEKTESQTSLQRAETDYGRGMMKSPVDGVILERLVSSERHLAAGTELVTIGKLENLEIEADVLSEDVVRVQVGNEVEIYGPTIGKSPARGRVTRIYPAGFTKVSSLGVEEQRVRVLIRFEDEELVRLLRERNLGVGYRVRTRIFTARKDDAIVVPRSALFRSPSGGWQCFAVAGGRIRLADVGVGLMNDRHVEVVEGLAEGDRVVIAPETSLSDAMRVRSIETLPTL